MEITTKLVNHLAELSRLEFNETETENFKKEFEQTLAQMQKLEQANTDNINLESRVLDAETELKVDEPHQSLSKNDVTKNAPETMGSSVAVPIMME